MLGQPLKGGKNNVSLKNYYKLIWKDKYYIKK